MGMFDYIECEYPLPDGFVPPPGWEFQTKDTEAMYMEVYRITKDGRLIHEACDYEIVPEEERPYYGKPEFEGFLKIAGSQRKVNERDEDEQYHGDLEFYGSNITGCGPEGYITEDDAPMVRREYTARFTNGNLQEIRLTCSESSTGPGDGEHITREAMFEATRRVRDEREARETAEKA